MVRKISLILLPLAIASCGTPAPSTDNVATNQATAQQPVKGDPRYAFRGDDDPQLDGKPGSCDFAAWSSDSNPAGLPVRAEPSATAAVTGTLPPPVLGESRNWSTTFDVVESRNGWFRIAHVNAYTPQASKPLDVTGWIPGDRLGFELQTDAAFADPDPGARVVATSWQDSDGKTRHFAFRNPTECKGHWLRLTVAGHDGKESQAWSRGVCGVQESTCEGDVRGTQGDSLNELPRY